MGVYNKVATKIGTGGLAKVIGGAAALVTGAGIYVWRPDILNSTSTVIQRLGAYTAGRAVQPSLLDVGVIAAEVYAGFGKKLAPYVYATLAAGVPQILDGLTKEGVTDPEGMMKNGLGRMVMASGIAVGSLLFRKLTERF